LLKDQELGFDSPQEQSFHSVKTGPKEHVAYYPVTTGSPFKELKKAGREVLHSPLSKARVNSVWIYTSAPPYIT
jgi:hypothetical protein